MLSRQSSWAILLSACCTLDSRAVWVTKVSSQLFSPRMLWFMVRMEMPQSSKTSEMACRVPCWSLTSRRM